MRQDQPGDDAGVVQRRALAAIFGDVEALEEVGPSATMVPARVPMARKASMRGLVVSALCVTSSGITTSGMPDLNTISAASGST